MKRSEFEFMVLDTIMRQQLSYPRLVGKMANKLSVRKTAIKHYVKDTLKDYKRLGLITMDDSKNFRFLDQHTFTRLYGPSPKFQSNKFNIGMVKDNNDNDGVEEIEMFSEDLVEADEGVEFEEAPMIAPLNVSQMDCISLKPKENQTPKSNPSQDLKAVPNLEQMPSKSSHSNEVANKLTSPKIMENFSESEEEFFSDDCYESPSVPFSAPELHDISKMELYSEACLEQQKLETMSTPPIKFNLDRFKILNGEEVPCEFKVWNDTKESNAVLDKSPQATDPPSIKSEKISGDNLSEQLAVGISSQIGKEKCVECQDAVVSLSQVEGFQYPRNQLYWDIFKKYYVHYSQPSGPHVFPEEDEPRRNARTPIVLNSERVCLGRLRHLKQKQNRN